ncbi:MAG: hypothetical protein V1911_02095 [Candidatus Micrarchaeota archaeon]
MLPAMLQLPMFKNLKKFILVMALVSVAITIGIGWLLFAWLKPAELWAQILVGIGAVVLGIIVFGLFMLAAVMIFMLLLKRKMMKTMGSMMEQMSKMQIQQGEPDEKPDTEPKDLSEFK